MNTKITDTYKSLHERLQRATALAGVYAPVTTLNSALALAQTEISIIQEEQNEAYGIQPCPPMPPLPVGTFVISNGNPAVWDGKDFAPVQSYLDDKQDELNEKSQAADALNAENERLMTVLSPYFADENSNGSNIGEVLFLSEKIMVRTGAGVFKEVQSYINGLRKITEPFVDNMRSDVPPARFGEVRVTYEGLRVWAAGGGFEPVQLFVDSQVQRGDKLAAELAAVVVSRDKIKAEESRVQKLLTECQASRDDWHKKADEAHQREQRLIERAERAEGQLKDANSLIVKQLEAIKAARRAWLALQPAWTGEDEYPYAYLLEGIEN